MRYKIYGVLLSSCSQCFLLLRQEVRTNVSDTKVRGAPINSVEVD